MPHFPGKRQGVNKAQGHAARGQVPAEPTVPQVLPQISALPQLCHHQVFTRMGSSPPGGRAHLEHSGAAEKDHHAGHEPDTVGLQPTG